MRYERIADDAFRIVADRTVPPTALPTPLRFDPVDVRGVTLH